MQHELKSHADNEAQQASVAQQLNRVLVEERTSPFGKVVRVSLQDVEGEEVEPPTTEATGDDSGAQGKRPTERVSSSKPSGDMHLTKKIIEGTHCFQGGGRSWWKFEFCPGKHVLQFHEHPDGKVDRIVLGKWDEEEHRKRYRVRQPDDSKTTPKRRQFSNYYVDGDFCEDAKRNREVIVRMLCRTTLSKDQAIMSLEEDPKCQYTLTMRSNAACDLLELVDDEAVLPHHDD
eukprot:m.230645 g.230645  ORF g.230645 m.230645 type:complete len:232 (-) comp17060_c8_seq8:1365-2060(-)